MGPIVSGLVGFSILVLASIDCFPAPLSVTITNSSFWTHNGTIRTASGGLDIGSGFVVGPQKDVITCYHVSEFAQTNFNETNLLFVCNAGIKSLKLKVDLPSYDIAVFSTTPEIIGETLRLGDFKKLKKGDTVLYVGYDTRQSKTKPTTVINLAQINEVVQMTNRGVMVEALFFTGDAIPGYSGGPVYNTNMEIVALLTKVGAKKLNVAFSIAPILELEQLPANGVVRTNLPIHN